MKNTLILIVAATALSACGGGSGDEAPAGVQTPSASALPSASVGMQKYVGLWKTACMAEGNQSVLMTIHINPPNGNTSSGVISATGFEFAGCAGRSATTNIPVTLSYATTAQDGTETVELTESGVKSAVTFIASADGKAMGINDGEETMNFTKE